MNCRLSFLCNGFRNFAFDRCPNSKYNFTAIMEELTPDSVESSELLFEAFNFWFADRQHIRSPFPKYIHEILRRQATNRFFEWAKDLNNKAKEDLNEPLVAEKLEEIIFATAMDLVKTFDEKLTIRYPFLPRMGDEINRDGASAGIVVDRLTVRENDIEYMKLVVESPDGGRWDTRIELLPS